jgi:hypothetical protein
MGNMTVTKKGSISVMSYMLKHAVGNKVQCMADTLAISDVKIQSADFNTTVFAGSVTACRLMVADTLVVLILFAR